MFLESQVYSDNKTVNDRISRAIDNDHTAAMKAPSESKRLKKKGGVYPGDMIQVCMVCQKAFKNPVFYRKHMRLHSDKAPHQCHLCRKSFVKKHHLQSHLQSHAKHQYTCPYCPKCFSQKTTLNQHLKFHSPKKVFKCDMCDKDFYQQEHLKAHLRHHNNERPFECEICQKSFNIKSSLQRHMNCHTGEKPFICDICNRGYTRRSVLMLHIQQVHENKKPFQCDECQLCFSQKGNLQAHFRRKHLQAKSDGRRGKDKEGKMKRIKRSHSRTKSGKSSSGKNFVSLLVDDGARVKLNKSKGENSSLHSYASKVKAIVSRGARAQATENQRILNKYSKSVYSLETDQHIEVYASAPVVYNSPSSLDSSGSSCSLSDEAPDTGCGSSSGEDIPDLNFADELGGHADADIKSLSDFETLLNGNRVWDDYLMSDAEMPSSSLPQYEVADIFSSPSKSGVPLMKGTYYGTDEYLTWAEDCAANPLFTAEDLDNIKDISSMCGTVDSIKSELHYSQTSKGIIHLSSKGLASNSLLT